MEDFLDELSSLIASHDLSIAEVVGCLELIKHDLLQGDVVEDEE